jgi:homoserine dehydrogenase
MHFNIAFIGFGTVGQGLARLLLDKEEMLKKRHGLEYTIVAISDKIKGAVYCEGGMDLNKMLKVVAEGGRVDEYPEGQKGMDAVATIKDSNANLIVEVTFTNIKTGEPALSHVYAALESGKHVVTTNKGPTVVAYDDIRQMEQANGAHFLFEGAVMSGTPVLNLALNQLGGCDIKMIRGILNGTTNYILSQMETGKSYEDSLIEAQDLGYAEADPTADVEGYDALGKVVILANVTMGADLKPEDVERIGITHISLTDIASAKERGKRIKLIGMVSRGEDGRLVASVQPRELSTEDPLASIMGNLNAVTFTTDALKDVTMVGPGAGKIETGYALLQDMIELNKRLKECPSP